MNQHADIGFAMPQNVEAEQAILGAILMNNDAFWRVADFLEPDHFYEQIHARIFEAMGRLIRAGKSTSPITLKTFFEGEELVPGVDAQAYLARLAGAAVTVINAESYGRLVFDLAVRRNLIAAGQDMIELAGRADAAISADDLTAQVETVLYSRTARQGTALTSMEASAVRVVDSAAQAYREGGRLAGLSTGLRDLDQLIGPMLPGDMIVLGGSTSSGKTSLAQNIAEFVGATYKVAFATLEMTSENLGARSIAQRSGVQSWRIESGRFSEDEFKRITEAADQLKSINLKFLDLSKAPVSKIRSAVTRESRLNGLDFLVIDHLRFIRFEDQRTTLAEGTAQITSDIKALAKQLEIPILLLAQFNRELQKRDSKRPVMSDLYGGAAIEQDADMVFFVHREEYWLERSEPPTGTPEHNDWTAACHRAEGKADCILAKRRRGRGAGHCVLAFDKQFTRFSDYDNAPEGQGTMV